MKKRIVFFDGDGTLWYPKKTKHEKGAWEVYKLPGGVKEHLKHLILTPTSVSTLKKLKQRGVITVLLSTHPHPPKEADEVLKTKVEHFKIKDLFDEVHATREYFDSKKEFILKILKQRGINKEEALMVGDNYFWDYKPADDIGVDVLIIETKHHDHPEIKKKIKKISEVLDYF